MKRSSFYHRAKEEALRPSAKFNKICLSVLLIYAIWSCWQTYLATRVETMQFVQIMLPDPVPKLFLNSFYPIIFISISLIFLKRVHIPLAVVIFAATPILREALRWADEIPGSPQPTLAFTITWVPLAILILVMIAKRRFRSLDAIAVAFSYLVIFSLSIFYHVCFLYPVKEQTNLERTERLERMMLLSPDQLESEMAFYQAKDVSSLSPQDISYLNSITSMEEKYTFAGESAAKILEERPRSSYYYLVYGRTFVDLRAIVYDGRGDEPRLWVMPADFSQKQLIIVSGGFYLILVVVCYFWTLMALFLCHIHGARVERIQPFGKTKYLRTSKIQ